MAANEKRASGTRGVRPEARESEQSQVQGTRPSNTGQRGHVSGPGSANEQHEGRPTVGGALNPRGPMKPKPAAQEGDDLDTATPGGALGTASQEELTSSPERTSSKSDDRMETDER